VKYLVTGGAGFIGSNLVDALMADPQTEQVVVVDNLSSGRRDHIAQHLDSPRFQFCEHDLLKPICLDRSGIDCVYHLAANPDARLGITNTRLDLEQETLVTYNVLEAMRREGVLSIIFSSSGTVYGDQGLRICGEDYGPCLPISLYGAGKLASEGLISAFCNTFKIGGVALRFGNVVGERATHGCIYDFIRQLQSHPDRLDVLGDGNQSKPYVYVSDIVEALMFSSRFLIPGHCDVFNVAPDRGTTVRHIARYLIRKMGLEQTKTNYGDEPFGWPGDVPISRMHMGKLLFHGFKPLRDSDSAVELAIDRILA
jgi:UDP-glucose 4-epimerase